MIMLNFTVDPFNSTLTQSTANCSTGAAVFGAVVDLGMGIKSNASLSGTGSTRFSSGPAV